MSFILDALRKSEHERQRQTGPGLAEVAVAAPRTRTSAWATAAVALLVVNLLAIGVLMLWRARAPEPQAATAPAAAPSRAQEAPPTPPAAAAAAPANGAVAAAAVEPGADTGLVDVPPMLQPADASAPGAGTRNPLADEVADGAMLGDPVLAERAASVPAGPPAVAETGQRAGTVVYEPLPGPGGAMPDATQGLPTIDDAGLAAGLPEMHIDLHVYSTRQQDRFVFVNKRKYREGETLQEGPRVEEITRDGVVLSQNGRRFVLPRQ